MKRWAEVLKSKRFLDRLRDQRRIGNDTPPGVGIVVKIEGENAHEARQRFHARHDEGRRGQHDLALRKPVAVDFGFGKMRDQVVGRMASPRRYFRRQEIAQFLEGGDVLRRSPFGSLVGRDREDNLAPDFSVIAVRQAHGAEQQADGDLAGKIVDELERSLLDDAVKRTIGDLQRRLDHAVEIPFEKRRLA